MASEKQMKFGQYAETPNTYVTASGALPVAEGRFILSAASVLAVTVALPNAETVQGVAYQDGTKMEFISSTAEAHTITTPANGINGNKETVTFGGAVGDLVTLVAVNGIWLVTASVGTTLS